jgi:protein O-GlcNAc transferase
LLFAFLKRLVRRDGRAPPPRVPVEPVAPVIDQREPFDGAQDSSASGSAGERPTAGEHELRADNALRQGLHADAARAYEASLAIDASSVNAWYNLGLCRLEVAKPAAAAEAFDQAAKLDPARAKSWLALAEASRRSGAVGKAVNHYREYLQRAPQDALAWANLAKLEHQCGRSVLASKAYGTAWRLRPDNDVWASNHVYISAFCDDVSTAELLERAKDWSRVVAEATGVVAEPQARLANVVFPRERRIRIGYLSADFREHSLRFFFMPLLRHHDRVRFDVRCCNLSAVRDDVQEAMRTMARERGDADWIDAQGWSNEELSQRIELDGIDVLVDLAGHTRGNRLAMLLRRRAPLTITALGFPCTTGLDTIDFKLTDAEADPPQASRFYSEALMRLERGFWCFEPPDGSPEVAPPPSARDAGVMTFGYFGEPGKLSDEVLDTWAQLLARVPTARLLLKLSFGGVDAELRAQVLERLGDHGLALDRVTLAGPTAPLSPFLEQYRSIDVVLDTWPFAGGTTTCLALWMGVPVITLTGDALRSRMGVSMLHRLGLDEWIAPDRQAYVAIAERVAADPRALVELRRSMRERMLRSPLLDGLGWTREFEAACEEALRTACANRS